MSDAGAAITELLEARYAACVNTGDAQGYGSLYCDDVIWSVPTLPDRRTPTEIEASVREVFAASRQRLRIRVEEIEIHGDIALVAGLADGSVTPTPDGVARPIALRLFWVLRRDDRGWRISRQFATPKPLNGDL